MYNDKPSYAAELQQLGGSALAQIALPVGHEDFSNLLMRASAANLQTVIAFLIVVE